MFEIYWRLILETNDKKKAYNLKDTFINKIGKSHEINSLEQYWKNEEQFVLELRQFLDPDVNKKEVFSVILNFASIMSEHWQIEIESDSFKTDIPIFSGIVNEKIKIKGISWMSFTLQERSFID